MKGLQSSEASPYVVTGILGGQSHDVYALIDPNSTFSYVTPYVAMEFGIKSKQLNESFSLSALVGESIVVAWIYRDCVVTVRDRDTMANRIELRMVDFDVIMGMDWLYSCFAKIDCRTKTVRLEFSTESVIEWKGDNVVPKVFPDEIPGIPPKRDIDFVINVMPGTQPISIPDRMAPAELKELKEQLKDLLERASSGRLEYVMFLGYVVSREVIKVDPLKISAVKNCPRPSTPTKIRSFMGLA
ncbi:uncharacterized protein [Nicotiana tomentosiformis]|uniref:uncharacterized protein n=1 Tax=Nicotiana tomentosiformis TaxID=4098 RepID=UPI00388CC58A